MYMLTIITNLLLAWVCAYYAMRRGYNPIIGFIAGIFFGVLALITLFILPNRKSQSQTPSASKVSSIQATCPIQAQKLWYYLNDKKEQFGPMSFNALSRAWVDGAIQEKTYVWNEEMENWQPLKEVASLQQS